MVVLAHLLQICRQIRNLREHMQYPWACACQPKNLSHIRCVSFQQPGIWALFLGWIQRSDYRRKDIVLCLKIAHVMSEWATLGIPWLLITIPWIGPIKNVFYRSNTHVPLRLRIARLMQLPIDGLDFSSPIVLDSRTCSVQVCEGGPFLSTHVFLIQYRKRS